MTAQRSVRSLDLNLLVTLDALLRLRNVTHAAAELRLSQPAVSAALGRLRRHFADELLMRRGNRFELTPLAAVLLERTPLALAEARRIFDASPSFDPGSARREFTVMMSDYAAVTLAPLLARRVAAAAPGVKLRLPQPTPAVIDRAPDALRALDGVVLPHGFLSGLPHADLFEDTWACIVSSDNDEVGERLTVAQLATLPWVVLMDRPTGVLARGSAATAHGDRAARRGHRRRVPRHAVLRRRQPAGRPRPTSPPSPAAPPRRRPRRRLPAGSASSRRGVLVASHAHHRPRSPVSAPSARAGRTRARRNHRRH